MATEACVVLVLCIGDHAVVLVDGSGQAGYGVLGLYWGCTVLGSILTANHRANGAGPI